VATVQDVALLSRLTSMLAETPVHVPLSDRLLHAFVQLMEVDGGAITIGFSKEERTVLAVHGALGDRIEELEDVLREGPALDAFRNRAHVIADPEMASVAWPLLSQSLAPESPAMAAYPMIPHAEVLGVVSTYQLGRQQAALGPGEAAFLANIIGVTIVGRFERSDTTDLVWSARDRIDHAVGMVVVQLRIAPTDALALLRAHAFAHTLSMSEVADAVVERGLDFGKRHEGGG
jgi:hypothetical protein